MFQCYIYDYGFKVVFCISCQTFQKIIIIFVTETLFGIVPRLIILAILSFSFIAKLKAIRHKIQRPKESLRRSP